VEEVKGKKRKREEVEEEKEEKDESSISLFLVEEEEEVGLGDRSMGDLITQLVRGKEDKADQAVVEDKVATGEVAEGESEERKEVEGEEEAPGTPSTTTASLDGRRKVAFHKMSRLSPKKTPSLSPLKAPTAHECMHRGMCMCTARPCTPPTRPRTTAPPSPKRPAVSRNLFTPEVEVRARVATLAGAVTDAKALKAKLTPAEVKAKLGKVKLKDLRARLASLDSSRAAVAASPAKVTARPPAPASSMVVEVLRTPRKVPASPLPSARASPRKVPAYQRFHSLTKPVDRAAALPLPYTYRMLGEVFGAADTLVAMHYNRGEALTLAQLEEGVRGLTNKPCLGRYLPQVRCLFPEAFTFAWAARERMGRVSYSLQVTPNLAYRRALQGVQSNNQEGEVKKVEEKEGGKASLTPEELVARRHIFTNALTQLVKEEHAVFLASLSPPIVVDPALLTAWHPAFPLDSCPQIDETGLPPHPEAGVQPGVEEVVVKKENTEEVAPTTTIAAPPTLLERVRAKEAARAVREMTRPREERARLARLRRLPDLARKMRALLISERRASVTVEFAVTKLLALAQGGDRATLEEDLRSLPEETDAWVALHRVAMEDIFKIAKPHKVNQVVELLEAKLAAALK